MGWTSQEIVATFIMVVVFCGLPVYLIWSSQRILEREGLATSPTSFEDTYDTIPIVGHDWFHTAAGNVIYFDDLDRFRQQRPTSQDDFFN